VEGEEMSAGLKCVEKTSPGEEVRRRRIGLNENGKV
jgi:hypothetical protein